MDISNITKAVIDFWDFIWPRIINITLLIFILYLFNKDIIAISLSKFDGIVDKYYEKVNSKKILKIIGIRKVSPLILLFTLLFFSQMIYIVTNTIGNILPPIVTYNPDLLLISTNMDRYLEEIAKSNIEISDISKLSTYIDNKVVELEKYDQNLNGYKNWVDKNNIYNNGMCFLKSYCLFAFVSFVIALIRRQNKGKRKYIIFFAILFLCIFIFFFFLLKSLYCMQQYQMGKIFLVRNSIVGQSGINDDIIESVKSEIDILKEQYKNKNWWELQLYNIDWLKNVATLFNRNY